MILRLPKDAYPLTPELQAPKKKKAKKKQLEVITETTVTGDTSSDDVEIFENVQVFPINK